MIGVMNSLEAVIASIQGLSASSEDLSALHDLLKGAEESLRTDWDVKPSTLDQLDPLKHSLGYLYLLEVVTCGPVSKENASDVVLLIAQFINTCDAGQIRLASEKFVTLCKRLKDNVLEIKDPLRGVTPLLKAVHKLQVSTKSLTALHPDLLQLCLQAECYETGFSILSDDIVEVDQPRDFFLYCYYGGMICIGQKKLQKALELLYNVVTAPMHLVNAIALEAYKKYILVSLIHNGQFSNNLPKSASTAAQRDLKNYCIPYVEVGNCYNEGKISELEAIIVANSSDFEKDKNLGLVKQAVSSLYKRNILRLTQKYSTLSLHDIANMVHLANAKEAEMHVLQMIQDSQIHAHINQKDGMVRFLESKKQCRDVEDVKDIATEDDSRGKRRKKEEKQREYEQVEMEKLQNLLFGSLYSPVTFGKQDGVTEADGSALYHVDRSAVDYEDEDEQLSDEEKGQTEGIREGEAAWEDEEEKQININIATVNRLRKLRKEENEGLISGSEYIMRLRAHHAKLNPGTDWARQDSQFVDGESSDDEYEHGGVDAEILRTNEDLVVKFGGTKLCPGLLEYSKLVDANAADPSNGPINSVHFHQNAQLLLTAGLDRRLKFFQIDGKRNTKIQSIFLEDCPIRKAAFLPNGSQVIVSGRRKFFYSFDLENAKFDKIGPLVGREEKSLEHFEVSQDSNTIAFVGNEGYILLVSSKTKELSGTLKMNGSVRSLAFSDDGKQLLSSGGDGQVYLWDLRTMKCLYKGVDEGSTCGTSLCSSLDGALFASGTDKGIVNIYRKSEFVGGKRKPIKTVDNLTSKIDFMQFNHDAQILAIVSTMNKNSVKLVHVPSLTVFSNWPPPNSTMHYPRCLDFSPGSGFMAMGNAAGKVLLYKLHHYQNA